MGMIDVLPTIGNMLDIDNKYALGNDIFEVKNKCGIDHVIHCSINRKPNEYWNCYY